MDSKFRRLAIIAAILAIAVVVLLVLLFNRDSMRGSTRGQEASADSSAPPSRVYTGGQVGDNLSAFMDDDSFWDPEPNEFLDKLLAGKNLSLIVTSVERDLRIQVVDGDGKLVTGEGFYVDIVHDDENTACKDLDRDGVIYVADLEPGTYDITLRPVEGYRVPTAGTRANVRDRVEYAVIDDISLLIMTEDEIDAAREDAEVQIAEEDRDDTEYTGPEIVPGEGKYGIDVSKFQQEIDWQAVKDDGVEFAIIRCGYRGYTGGMLVEDSRFEYNLREAKRVGMPVGIYFFTQAVNEIEAVEEASMCIALLQGMDLEYPIFIDTEGSGSGGKGRADNLDPATRTLVCEAFCRTIANSGRTAGVYASRNWYYNNIDIRRLENDFVVWLAEYRDTPKYEGYYQLWQYTSKGRVAGIEGNVDRDVSYLKTE